MLALGALVLTACSDGDVLSGHGSAAPGGSIASTPATVPTPGSSSLLTSSSMPAASAASSSPQIDAPTSAAPAPTDQYSAATCSAITRVLAKTQTKPGPVPAITSQRESIGGLLEEMRSQKGFATTLQTSGTYVTQFADAAARTGYECYSGVPDIGLKFSFEELGYFYKEFADAGQPAQSRQHTYLFQLNVKLKASKRKAPAIIYVAVFGGLSRDVIDRAVASGSTIPVRGSVFISWTLDK